MPPYAIEQTERQHSAVKGELFHFGLPGIRDIDPSLTAPRLMDVEEIADQSSDPTAWNVSLSGFPAGMEIVDDRTPPAVSLSTNGYASITAGSLGQYSLRWTPTLSQSFYVQDGRPRRPRVWVVTVQIDGTGAWLHWQFEVAFTITVTDRVLHAEELRDEDSIEAYGEHREIGLPWYQHDHLDEALERRYVKPPRMVGLSIPLVQEDDDKLRHALTMEPGQVWQVGTSGTDANETMLGMVTSVDLQIAAGGNGLSFKRVNVLEMISTGIVISVGGVPLAIGGQQLAVGGT